MLKRVILFVGAFVVAVAAAWASFSTLAALAEATEWASGAWLLPTSIDVLGALACYVWLTKSFPQESRRFARGTTFAAIAVSVVGNGVGHLVSSGMLSPSVMLIVLVGAVPPSSLAALIHLIVLATSTPVPTSRRGRTPAVSDSDSKSQADSTKKPSTTRKSRSRTQKAKPTTTPTRTTTPTDQPTATTTDETDSTSEGEFLLHRAKKADEASRQETGRPISRDRLRDELNVGTATAADLVRQLRQEGVA